jgi:hypothetical protein
MHAEISLLTSLLGRHLHQQQQAAAAATTAAAAAAPPPASAAAPAAVDFDDSVYTESPTSGAAAATGSRGGTSTPPVPAAAAGGTPTKQGQRVRRKNTDSMQKLQVCCMQIQQCLFDTFFLLMQMQQLRFMFEQDGTE